MNVERDKEANFSSCLVYYFESFSCIDLFCPIHILVWSTVSQPVVREDVTGGPQSDVKCNCE